MALSALALTISLRGRSVGGTPPKIAQRKAMLIPHRRTEGQGRRVSRSSWG